MTTALERQYFFITLLEEQIVFDVFQGYIELNTPFESKIWFPIHVFQS